MRLVERGLQVSWSGVGRVDRREYEWVVDRFRRLVASLPAWRVEEHDGVPVLADASCGGLVFRLGSRWDPYLTRYFEAVDKYRLLGLVALLEVIPPDGQAHRAAVAFLEYLAWINFPTTLALRGHPAARSGCGALSRVSRTCIETEDPVDASNALGPDIAEHVRQSQAEWLRVRRLRARGTGAGGTGGVAVPGQQTGTWRPCG